VTAKQAERWKEGGLAPPEMPKEWVRRKILTEKRRSDKRRIEIVISPLGTSRLSCAAGFEVLSRDASGMLGDVFAGDCSTTEHTEWTEPGKRIADIHHGLSLFFFRVFRG
jgi:hypothetical protein